PSHMPSFAFWNHVRVTIINYHLSRKYSNKFCLWYERYIIVYVYMQNRRIIIHFPNTDIRTLVKTQYVVVKVWLYFSRYPGYVHSVDSKYCWAVKMIIIRPRQVKTKN